MNSKQITDHHLKAIKLIDKPIEDNISDTELIKDFLNKSPKVQIIKDSADKMDFSKIKIECPQKDTMREIKRQAVN